MYSSRLLLAFLFLPVFAACDDDGDLGLGLGQGERFSAALAGANVRPSPVVTTATGTTNITVREPAIGSSVRTVGYQINITGLTSVTAAHIHLGGSSVANGTLLVTLFTNSADTTITATELVAGSFVESSIGGGVGLDSLVSLMRSGNAYVDLHGRAGVDGVVRGQITRAGETAPLDRFAARSLTGAKERPTPVTTPGSGSATFELQSNGSVRYEIRVVDLTGATAAHIHHAVADSAGPIVVPLFSTTTPTGSLTGVLANGTFTAANIQLPGVSLDSLLSLMRRGRTYVNVHTSTNQAGEIRAQIEAVSVLP